MGTTLVGSPGISNYQEPRDESNTHRHGHDNPEQVAEIIPRLRLPELPCAVDLALLAAWEHGVCAGSTDVRLQRCVSPTFASRRKMR